VKEEGFIEVILTITTCSFFKYNFFILAPEANVTVVPAPDLRMHQQQSMPTQRNHLNIKNYYFINSLNQTFPLLITFYQLHQLDLFLNIQILQEHIHFNKIMLLILNLLNR